VRSGQEKHCRSRKPFDIQAKMITRPIMRYPGGKYSLAKWVISHFPAHETYVELFGGAASVLMRKPRSIGEVYNDLNGDVVNVFRVLRNYEQAAQLARMLALTPYANEEYRLAYEPCDDPIERARRMIFRSFAGHGSDSVTRSHAGFRGHRNKESGVTVALLEPEVDSGQILDQKKLPIPEDTYYEDLLKEYGKEGAEFLEYSYYASATVEINLTRKAFISRSIPTT